VLKHIQLSIDQGDYLAIMGPSGSGKSTLMNLIGCLDVPTSGTYHLNGQNISQMGEDQLADLRNQTLGFVFQNFNLLPKLTARDNVALPLLYAGVNKKERSRRAEEVLEKVGLAERVDFYPTQLSGGQQQRVAIARAMINRPKLLLADEPTGALDTASGEQVMELFDQLNADGATIVLITHEPAVGARAKSLRRILDGELLPAEGGESRA
jgi:putative ABC transport system ATP-binding protein